MGALGLSSYRATMQNNFYPVFANGCPHLDDEQWMRLFSNKMLEWFALEREFLAPGSPTFLQILVQRGYIDLAKEFNLDFNRITGVDNHV